MREIKFRAWDKGGHKMINITKLAFNDEDGIAIWALKFADFGWRPKEEYELMQFSGQRFEDNEAYEGDVIGTTVGAPWNEEEPMAITGIVEWGNCQWWFKGIETGTYDAPLCEYPTFVVLGNIYENPELLSRTISR